MLKFPIAALTTLMLLPFYNDISAKEAKSSIYERFVFKKCPIIEQGERDSTHRCKMKKGAGSCLRLSRAWNYHLS